jgi:hypothetical protein
VIKFTHSPVSLAVMGWHDTGQRIEGTAASAIHAASKHACTTADRTHAFRLSTDPDTWGIFTRTPDILT